MGLGVNEKKLLWAIETTVGSEVSESEVSVSVSSVVAARALYVMWCQWRPPPLVLLVVVLVVVRSSDHA
jgi:hypothetical protein